METCMNQPTENLDKSQNQSNGASTGFYRQKTPKPPFADMSVHSLNSSNSVMSYDPWQYSAAVSLIKVTVKCCYLNEMHYWNKRPEAILKKC